MSKHTKGPWLCNAEDPLDKTVTAADGRSICAIYESDSPESVWRNFQLIAAAPELLEALDRLVASTETANNRMELSISSGALNQARAAIAKARGEA